MFLLGILQLCLSREDDSNMNHEFIQDRDVWIQCMSVCFELLYFDMLLVQTPRNPKTHLCCVRSMVSAMTFCPNFSTIVTGEAMLDIEGCLCT